MKMIRFAIIAILFSGCIKVYQQPEDLLEKQAEIERYKKECEACKQNLYSLKTAVELARLDGIASPTSKDIYGEDKYIKTSSSYCPSSKIKYSLDGLEDENWFPKCPNPYIHKGFEKYNVLPHIINADEYK